jgi:hypothetical protein
MPFNGPIDGDYTNVDFKQAPWTNNECMVLTHNECLQVLEGFETVKNNYDPAENYGNPISEQQLHSDYNMLDWQYAINWNTFTALQGYNPEVNTEGTDAAGIIQPEPEQLPEEPTEETPADIMDEPATEEETVTE